MTTTDTTRRDFIRVAALAGGGMLIGVHLPSRERLAAIASAIPGAAPPFAPNAWIRIGTDGIVTVVIDKSEMGQGVTTSLAMLVAEDLDADWTKIRTEMAPVDPVYNNTMFGIQATGGSSSVRSSWKSLRTAGAAAREMLVAAAAAQWNVPAQSCSTANGEVIHAPTRRKLGYGSLATAAAAMPVPAAPMLTNPRSFKIIGKRVKRLDSPSKVNGSAVFGMDVKLPGLLTAVIARPPVTGAPLVRHDAAPAMAVAGVRSVVPIDSGVAVVAQGFWAAKKGCDALKPTWGDVAGAPASNEAVRATLRAAAKTKAIIAKNEGDAAAAIGRAATKVTAEYDLPFLAHAAMEPLNCTAHVRADGCDIYAPTQRQDETRAVAARITGLAPDKITVTTTFLGGGFGRKFEMDFITEAVQVSKAVGAPVKVVWTREDDMRHDMYRPAAYHAITAGLDADGWPIAWQSVAVSPSPMARVFPQFLQNGLDGDAVEGLANMPYAIPNLRVEWVQKELGIPVGFWRSVGSSQNAFVGESFIDELATAAKRDPVDYRRYLLASKPRHIAVLNLAAERAGWGTPPAAGRARGIAIHESFGSIVAQVAEVSLTGSTVNVHKVVCVVDCGQVVNPDTVEAQMRSGIIYGLTAALHGEITIDRGAVKQGNFTDYRMIRMTDAPPIDVHIVASTEAPGGVGEPGTPPIAPAVANAVRVLTGTAVRSLPIRVATAVQAGRGGGGSRQR